MAVEPFPGARPLRNKYSVHGAHAPQIGRYVIRYEEKTLRAQDRVDLLSGAYRFASRAARRNARRSWA